LKALHWGQLQPFLKNHLKSFLKLTVFAVGVLVLVGVAVIDAIVMSAVVELSFAKEGLTMKKLADGKMIIKICKSSLFCVRICIPNVSNI
jgi:hypothetical protein